MKKVVVLSKFRDIRDFDVLHDVGDVLEVTDERAANLVSAGLATEKSVEAVLEEPKFEVKSTPTPTKKRGQKQHNNDGFGVFE